MRVQNTFTLILSKNYGPPVRWHTAVWRVYLAVSVAALVASLLLLLSFLYLVTYPRLRSQQQELEQLRQENSGLMQQIGAVNSEAYLRKQSRYALQLPQDFSDGAEALSASITLSGDEDSYVPPFRVSSLTVKIDRRKVEAAFDVVRWAEKSRVRGGYLFIVFENRDAQPRTFATSARGDLNAEGFPQFYKTGRLVTRIRNTATFREKVDRGGAEGYYTHVSLYLFSFRGALLVRERFSLDNSWFQGVEPVTFTQNLPQV